MLFQIFPGSLGICPLWTEGEYCTTNLAYFFFKTLAQLFGVANASYVFVEFFMIIILQQSSTEYENGDQLQLQSSRLKFRYNFYAVISTYPGEQAHVLMQTDCSCSHQPHTHPALQSALTPFLLK